MLYWESHGAMEYMLYWREITLVHRGKTHALDVKLKGQSIPIVSASTITLGSILLLIGVDVGDQSDRHPVRD